MKKILFLILLPVLTFASGQITGRVRESETKMTLPGVNVQLLGTLRGAVTDADGQFIIKETAAGEYTLRISMIGFHSVDVLHVKVVDDEQVEIAVELTPTAIEMAPMVVSAGKTKQSIDQTPVSLSVVTSMEIQQRNPTNLIEALENAPGVHFVGNQINIRGSTGYTFGAGNKVLLLLDGVPVYASDTGEFNWDMLPPLDIEQIEVVKGAGSTLWGASALGGVINVITKDPSPKGKLLFASTFGQYDRPYYDEWRWTDPNRLHFTREDLSYSRKWSSFGMRLSAGRLMTTGYTQLGDAKKYNLTGKFDYQFSSGIKWTGYAAYSLITRGFFVQWKGPNDPYEVDSANLSNHARVHQLNSYTKLIVPFSSRLTLNLRASYVRTLMGNQFGEGSGFKPAFGQGAEVEVDWIPRTGHVITTGVQYQHDTGNTKYMGNHQGFFLGPFLQDEWKLCENLRLTAGLRYDRYQLIGGLKEDLFSPRLGMNWQPWPATSFRASAGSGFRAATIVERFLEMSIMNFKIISNPELKAESSWAFDIGGRHYFNENWNVDVSFFDNEYWQLIEAHMDLIRGQVQFRNIDRARIRGIEAAANWSLTTQAGNWRVTSGLQASMTLMDHKDVTWKEPLTYRPKRIGNIRASLKIDRWSWQTDFRYASKIEAVKIYPINKRAPMKFIDTRLSYHLGPVDIKLGVTNLNQYNYAPMESNLMPMRTYTIGIQGEF